jgi:hypothetical protein
VKAGLGPATGTVGLETDVSKDGMSTNLKTGDRS